MPATPRFPRRLKNLSRTAFLLLAPLALWAADPTPPAKSPANLPSMVEADGRLRFDFSAERLALAGGLQPSMLVTKSGAIILQAQLPQKPFPTARMHYPYAMGTVVSRDNGETWTTLPLKDGDNGANLEGGITQLRDGTIIALDTYIIPGTRKDEGVGQRYVSRDEWRTVEGPLDAIFDL